MTYHHILPTPHWLHKLTHLLWARDDSNGSFYWSFSSLSLLVADLSVTAEMILQVQALQATVLTWKSQCQMPTAHLFSLALPQKEQVYMRCSWFPQRGPIVYLVFIRDANFLVHLVISPWPGLEPRESSLLLSSQGFTTLEELWRTGKWDCHYPGSSCCRKESESLSQGLLQGG